MNVDTALHAAVALFGPDRGHALIGCDWGTLVATPDDREICISQARQIVCLHHGEDTYQVKVCLPHKARLEQETDPHERPDHG